MLAMGTNNVSYRGPITMPGLWQMLRSHHLGLIKHIGENPQLRGACGGVLRVG